MLTFLNFNARQLASTDGFDRKINKLAESLKIKNVLYSEIIDIKDSSLDVLIIDEKMYFHKVHLYSVLVAKMLNEEFSRLLDSLGIADSDSSLDVTANTNYEDCNLIEGINSILSRAIQLLNVENSSNIDILENSTSSQFNLSIKNFTYDEIHSAVEPLVKDFIFHLYNFKIINLSKNSIEILAITTECKLFQYTIPISSTYSNFLNRYVSAILPYEMFVELKRSLRNLDFSAALKETIPTYGIGREKLDTCSFLTFLLNTYKKDLKGKGSCNEGLKNFHNFFFDTCSSKQEAELKIRSCYMQVKNYQQKKQLNSQEELPK